MGGSWFLYDRVSRLKEAHVKTAPTATGAEVWQAYRFDGFGNLLSASGTSAYNTPTDPQTNRLTAASFDSRGNQRSWAGAAHTWNALNQLENTVNGSENWFHVSTASDERLVSVSWNGGFKTLRLRDLDNRVLREYKQVFQGGNEVWTVERDYVYRGGTLLATETPTGRRHFHPDHLGTPRRSLSPGTASSTHAGIPCGS
jgi:hypothetical protein